MKNIIKVSILKIVSVVILEVAIYAAAANEENHDKYDNIPVYSLTCDKNISFDYDNKGVSQQSLTLDCQIWTNGEISELDLDYFSEDDDIDNER